MLSVHNIIHILMKSPPIPKQPWCFAGRIRSTISRPSLSLPHNISKDLSALGSKNNDWCYVALDSYYLAHSPLCGGTILLSKFSKWFRTFQSAQHVPLCCTEVDNSFNHNMLHNMSQSGGTTATTTCN